ncbi:hypothetical protein NFI96_007448, partial [Prochilodus magdalenae]
NRVLLMLLILMAMALLYKKTFKARPPAEHSDLEYQAPGQAVEGGDERYIERTKLKEIRYKILEFNPMVLKGKLNFVRFYLPLLAISDHRRIVYLDDDVIVQGDIQELYSIRLEPGHAAAFASDCDLPSTHEMVRSVGMQTTYMGFLDYRKQEVRDLGINPSDCSFNPGVFVADVGEWKKQKITKQLEKWMSKNFKENLYSSAMAGGVAHASYADCVSHDRYTTIDPKWHVRHLGSPGVPTKTKAGLVTEDDPLPF